MTQTRVKRTLCTWEPATVTLRSGDVIDIEVKRLDIGEAATFDRLFERAFTRESDRVLLARKPGEELAREVTSAISQDALSLFTVGAGVLRTAEKQGEPNIPARAFELIDGLLKAVSPTERFVLADQEIRRRRLLELTEGEQRMYEALKAQDAKAFSDCAVQALTDFVRVRPDQLAWKDADTDVVTDVRTGADLARCLGSDGDAVVTILLKISAVNRLSDVEKNVSGSRSNSRSSSKACDPTAVGGSPEAIAASVDPSVSVTSAGVTPTAASPSGAMAIS